MSSSLSPLEIALARVTIPDHWRKLGLPGKPGANCRSPFREDRHPSFSIYADGRRWHDHKTGADGDAADFLAAAYKVSRQEGCRLLIALAGTGGLNATAATLPTAVQTSRHRLKPLYDPAKAIQRRNCWPVFRPPTPAEIAAIARSRDLSPEGVAVAADRGLLFCTEWAGVGAWVITDGARFNGQARRMNGERWVGIDAKAWTLPGSVGGWPVGIHEAAPRPAIAVVEGGPDLLAAFHLAWCATSAPETLALGKGADALGNLGVVAMFGARNRIIDDALPLFAGKRVRIFADDDKDGYAGAAAWFASLKAAGAVVDCFSFAGFRQSNGDKVKDLNDFVRLDADQWEAERALVESAFGFVPAAPKLNVKTAGPQPSEPGELRPEPTCHANET